MDIQTLLQVAEAVGTVFVAATVMTLCMLGLDWMYHLHRYIRHVCQYWRRKFRR